MGLSIYYQLALPISCARITPAERLELLRESVLALPLPEVSPLYHFRAAECGPGTGRAWTDPAEFLKLWAGGHLVDPADPEQYIAVDPLELHGFVATIGRGTEPLALGLARFPEWISDRGRRLSTGLRGWRWQGACKTQYASVHGVDHFVRCHRAVLAALDRADSLGFRVTVRDDSGFNEHQDEARLRREVERANRLIASFAGALSDQLGADGLDASAPIFEHPRFEQLEMEGRAELRR